MTGSQPQDDAPISPDTSASKRIGRYVVTRELGRGGMGIVYEATDPAIGRRVAIKVINLQFLTGEGEAQVLRERLFREARSAGALSHPGIVVVYDVGEDHEMAFIAMEYVDGLSLQQIQKSDRKLQPAEVVDILRQVAAALDYAHRNGVVHRDIKPPNIMLHDGSQVKIADFGIAKITTAPKYTVTGLVMGTPAYMSPEQIEGREVDGRSDQFSLAVVAYELLTGATPFQGKTYVSMVHSIVYGERPSARAANPLLPAGFDAVLARGMAARPEDRFANCAEFAAALDRAQFAPEPVPVVPVAAEPLPSQPPRAGRRFPVLAASIFLAVALAGAAAVYRFWPGLRVEPGKGSVAQQAQQVQPAVPAEEKPPVKETPKPIHTEPETKDALPIETAKAPEKKQPEVTAVDTPAPEPVTTREVTVKSNQAWTFTGIVLRAGDTAGIVANGAIRVVADPKLASQQPGGFYPNCNRAKELFKLQIAAVPAPDLSCWSLIGHVGPHGPVFEIGVKGTAPAGSTGRLFLGVNDDNYADNSGAWNAVVTVEHH